MGQLQERYKSYREPQKYMAQGVYPYFRAITSKQGPEVTMAGHKVLMFGSNAYTGLTGDERVIAAAKKALDKYGSGCAGSRFLCHAWPPSISAMILSISSRSTCSLATISRISAFSFTMSAFSLVSSAST